MNLDAIADHFRLFSNIQSSPIYAALAGFVATQPQILQAINIVPVKNSPRTVLFAAVHALLLKGIQHPLADFYPTLNGKKTLNDENRSELCADFLDFFTRYQAELKPYFLKTTQTNEPKRSAALLPAFSEIIKREKNNTFSLIEIGTSAGFLLNVDKYSYKLNDFLLGDVGQHEPFSTEWRGNLPTNLKNSFIHIENKIGIDINPLNIEDPELRLWLKALIWPESVNRLKTFDVACQIFEENKDNITMLKGTLDDYVDQILSICSKSHILCFLAVWVLYQLSEDEKRKINETFSFLAKSTDKKIYFILDDWEVTALTEANTIILREFDSQGNYTDQKLAETHHHGTWVNSLLPKH